MLGLAPFVRRLRKRVMVQTLCQGCGDRWTFAHDACSICKLEVGIGCRAKGMLFGDNQEPTSWTAYEWNLRARRGVNSLLIAPRPVCVACVVDWPLRALVKVAKQITRKASFEWLKFFVEWCCLDDIPHPGFFDIACGSPNRHRLYRVAPPSEERQERFNRHRQCRRRYNRFMIENL